VHIEVVSLSNLMKTPVNGLVPEHPINILVNLKH
jgi:hypothetical protein